jgi:hypothetical protein
VLFLDGLADTLEAVSMSRGPGPKPESTLMRLVRLLGRIVLA